MKVIAKIAVVSLAVGVAFVAGMLVGRTSSDGTASISWTGTSDATSVLTEYDTRPIAFVDDGGTGIVDGWEVTASFRETDNSYGYGKRKLFFDVLIQYSAEEPPKAGDYNFLEDAMLFVSPSGRTATVRHQGDYSYANFDGIAYNGSESLPDEPGTFYLIFAPHPYKHRLVWSVDLPYLP